MKMSEPLAPLTVEEWVEVVGKLTAHAKALTAERDAAYHARDNFQAGIESMRQERTTLQREYAKACEERDALITVSQQYVDDLAGMTKERDALKSRLAERCACRWEGGLERRVVSECHYHQEIKSRLAEAQEQWTKTNAQYESSARAVTRLTIQLAATE